MEKPVPKIFLLLAHVNARKSVVASSQCVLEIQASLYPSVRSDELQHPEALDCKILINGITNKRHHPAELVQSINRGTRAAFSLLSREGYNRHIMKVVYILSERVVNQHGFSSDLAFSLAFITKFFRQNNYPNIAATGVVGNKGEIQAVTYINEKLSSALLELPDESWIFLPKANRSNLSQELITECTNRSIQLYYVDHLDQVCESLNIKVHHYYQYNPFRGLDCFELKHAALFFGRNKEIKQASLQLKKRWENNIPSLLISGASGSGKSSFAQAGLLHEAIYGKLSSETLPFGSKIVYSIFRPRQIDWNTVYTSNQRLWHAVIRHWSRMLSMPMSNSVNDVGTACFELQEAMSKYIERNSITGLRYIWVIDQLEEIFTLEWSEEERNSFIELITILPNNGIWVIATIRADIFPDGEIGRLLHKHFQSQGRYDLAPQDNVALRSIICEPAKLAGLHLDNNEGLCLEDRILQDMNYQTDALPLLQLSLSQLYEQRDRNNNRLTFLSYEKMGCVNGAISNWAQKTHEKLPIEYRKYFGSLLRHLVSVQKDAHGFFNITSRPALFSDLPEIMHPLVDNLVRNRLLIREKNTVRVTHEAIFLHWDLAKFQIERERNDLIFLHELRRMSHDFFNGKEKEKIILLSKENLKKALFFKDKWKNSLPHETHVYIEKSKKESIKKKFIYVTILISLIALAAIYLYLFKIEISIYYKNINRTTLMPKMNEEAILTRKQHMNNDRHYKVIRKGRYGEIKEIRIVNRFDECPFESASLLTTWLGDYSQRDFWSDIKICKITFDGKVEKGFNSLNTKMFEINYSKDDHPVWTEKGIYTEDNSLHPGTDADIVKFKYRENSKEIEKISFFSKVNNETVVKTDHYGVHEYYTHFKEDNKIRIDEFNNSGILSMESHSLCERSMDIENKKRKDGVAKIITKYNHFDDEIEVSYYNENDEPMVDKNGIQRISKSYDVNGNLKLEELFNEKGHIKYRIESSNKKTNDGYAIETHYFTEEDAGDEKCPRKDSYGNCYSSIEKYFDRKGRVVETSYYMRKSGENIPVSVAVGRREDEKYHKEVFQYDRNIKNIYYFDEHGQAIDVGNRLHRVEEKYDGKGMLLEASYFNLKGEPATHSAGHHAIRYDRNSTTGYFNQYQLLDINRGNFKKEKANLDVYSGYSKIKLLRDSRGNPTKVITYDHKGDISYYWENYYDNRDNKVSTSFYDKTGKSIPDPSKQDNPDSTIWLICNKYDANGNKIEEINYDVNKNPVMNRNEHDGGFAIQYTRYDPLSREPLCIVRKNEKNELISTTNKCTTIEKNISD